MITVKSVDKSELMGLSSDDKPNDVSVNTLFWELDTNKFYYCSTEGTDESYAVWTELGTEPIDPDSLIEH